MLNIVRPLARQTGIVLIIMVALAGCVAVEEEPAFYTDLGREGVVLDTESASHLINSYRRGQGLSLVTVDPQLNAIAQAMADVMVSKNSTGLSETEMADVRERLARAGYDPDSLGDNTSAGYRRMAEAFSGWRASPPHDAVMSQADATHMGIATAYTANSRFRVFWALVMVNRADGVDAAGS